MLFRSTCKISYVKRIASPDLMHDTGCLGLVHWDDPEGWDGEGGGRGIQAGEYIKPGLVICFTYDNIHVSMPFSQIIPPSSTPTESKRLFYTSMSFRLSRIQGYCYHLSKFHIYALVYCIGVFLSGLLHSV